MSAKKTFAGYHGHWFVLVGGGIAAVLIWIWWLCAGMDFARNHIIARAVPNAAIPTVTTYSFDTNVVAPIAAAPVGGRETMFAELGQTGDSFGGLNALLTAIAGALVFWAGFMQYQTLKQLREEAKNDQEHRKIQEFESLFFRLLELTATATERIEGPKVKDQSGKKIPRRIGTRALDSLARSLFDSINKNKQRNGDPSNLLKALVKHYLTKIYDRQPSAFGPYLRLLYQTFKHISESTLSEEQKIRYANIARGQISEGAVLLLALNGLAPYGYKFIPLIEKFGLLEHLHRFYQTEYKAALEIGYRRRAFLGSQERAIPGNEWQEKPLLSQEYFQSLETDREDADNESDFESGYSGKPEAV